MTSPKHDDYPLDCGRLSQPPNTERCGGEVERGSPFTADGVAEAYREWDALPTVEKLKHPYGAAWIELKTLLAALAEERAKGERMAAEQSELYGCLQFILAFYEPGQRHLDTEAWKVAEKAARYAMKTIKRADAPRRVLASP